MPSGFNPVGVTSVAGKTGTVILKATDITRLVGGATVIGIQGPAGGPFGELNFAAQTAGANSAVFRTATGASAIACISGLTAARPTADSVPVGYMFLNLTTSEMNFSNGTAWITALGVLAA